MTASDRSFFGKIDEDAEAAADEEGLAQLDAGKGVPHAEVAAWLETWGAADEKPARLRGSSNLVAARTRGPRSHPSLHWT